MIKAGFGQSFERLAVRLAARAKALVETRGSQAVNWRDARRLWPDFTGE